MKKLMIAASAVLCATVGFSVESANVVGYAAKTLQSGFTATGINFVNVGGTASNLNDLKVTGYEGSYADGGVVLSKLDEAGYVLNNVMWTWYDVEDPDMGTLYGWYNDDGDSGADEALTIGEGVWVQAPSSDFKIQVAGQVYTNAVPVTLQSGFTMCANPAPTALTLNDAVISGYGDSYADGGVVLSKLDEAGYVLDNIMWTWYDVEDPDMGTLYGWYNDDGDEGSTEPLGSGEAVWIQAPSSDFIVTFPSAL